MVPDTFAAGPALGLFFALAVGDDPGAVVLERRALMATGAATTADGTIIGRVRM